MTRTRLLLPFTGNINTRALGYAVQLAKQRQAPLVCLALLQVKPGKAARLEHIQQAQDFLEFVHYKAEQQGVPSGQVCLCTGDSVRSIEAVATEMHCETVILFTSPNHEVLLDLAQIRELLARAACHTHLVLLPPKRARHYPLYIPLPGRSDDRAVQTQTEILVKEDASLASSLLYMDIHG